MDLNVTELVRIVAKNRRLIMTSAAICGFLALIFSLVTPATYQSTALVLVKSTKVIETKNDAAPALPGQHEQLFARARVPDPGRPIGAGGGQESAIGAEGHGADIAGVPAQRQQRLAGRHVP